MSESVREIYQNLLNQKSMKEGLDYKFLLMQQFSAVSQLMMAEIYDPNRIDQAIMALYYMIPDSWKDKAFRVEYEAAKDKIEFDDRPIWCTRRIGPKEGHTHFEEQVNPLKLLGAISNLFDRLNMTLKSSPKSVLMGKRYPNAEDT